MPSFWLGIVFILGLLIIFSWLPPLVYTPFWTNPRQNLPQLDLAGARGRLPLLGGRHAHDALDDARGPARGLHPHRARQGAVREADRVASRAENAMLPVITVIGLEFAFLIGGLVVTEQVFNLNGIGMLFVDAVAPPRLHADAGAGPAAGIRSSSSSTSWST